MGAVVFDESGGAVLDESGSLITDDGVSPFFYLNEFVGTNGSAPTDFTTSQINAATGTIDIQSNQLRLLTSATNFHTLRLVLPSSNWLDDDGAVVLSYAPTTGLGQMNLIMRGSGSWSALGDAPSNGYQCFLNMAGAYFEIYRHNSGVATQVGTTQSYTWSVGSWYFTRFYTHGAQLKVKIWLVTENEPETWTYEVTDGSPYLTAGQFQMTFRNADSAVRDIRVGDVGIQTLPVAGVARSTGTANNAGVTITGSSASVNAQVAVSVGAAEWEADDSDSINLELYAAVSGAGSAYNATTTSTQNVSAAAQSLSKTGVANNATVTQAVAASATAAAGTGTANTASVTTTGDVVSVAAQAATGAGSATGISYLLDENGELLLDENDLPIEDGAGLTVRIAPTPGVATSAGASNAPSRSVSTRINAAAGVGAALSPSVSTTGGSTTTNVNPAVAVAAGAASDTTSLVSPSSTAATSTGAANAPQVTVPVQAAVAASVGAAYGLRPLNVSTEAVGVGAAYDPQVSVDGSNFITAAPIPVNATAPNANVGISVYPADASSTGTVPATGPGNEPGQLITLHDTGHTVTLKER